MGRAMTMCAALVALTAITTPTVALAGPAPLPVRRAPAPTAPPPAAAPSVVADAAKLAAELHDTGTRALAEAARQATPIDPAPAAAGPEAAPAASPGDVIPALGPCTRPSYDERTKLAEQLARRVPHQGELALQFGCKDAAGVLVSLAFDQPVPRAGVGVWRVVRVAPSGVTTLAEESGPAQSTWMESVHEVTLRPVVELDFDGDRIGDLVVARYEHEGGARHGNAALSIWLSKSRRRVALGSTGTSRDLVAIAARQPAVGHTLVLQLRRDTDSVADAQYRCVEPPGQLTICPAVDPARRFDRAVELATWFAGGHSYPPGDAPVPDRGQLAELLLPLQTFGVAAGERGQLLALAASPSPEQTIAHELERVRGLEVARQYGEAVDRPDPRAGRLLGMLGDAACPSISAAESRTATARLDAWIASRDKADLAAQDCHGAASCSWRRSGPLALLEACVAGKLAYYEAQWRYADGDQALVRRAVFRLDGNNLTMLARASATGDARPCDECVRPVPPLTAKLYRHRGTLVALALITASDASQLIVDADGEAVAVPESPGALGWYTLGEATADNVVRFEPPGELAYLHWDGSWKQLARYPAPTPRTPPPKLEPAAAWLWQQDHKAAALLQLREFDLARWSKQPAYRVEILQALAAAGADPATLARATTATGAGR